MILAIGSKVRFYLPSFSTDCLQQSITFFGVRLADGIPLTITSNTLLYLKLLNLALNTFCLATTLFH